MMEKILQMIFSVMVWFLIKVNLFPNVLVWKLKEIAWSMQSTVHVSLCLQSSLTGKFDNHFASLQGPSCSPLDPISSFKVTYVHFIIPESGKSIPSETLELDPFESQTQRKKMRRSVISHSVISAVSTAKSIVSFRSRYVEIWEEHQTCRNENSQCCGWRIWNRE